MRVQVCLAVLAALLLAAPAGAHGPPPLRDQDQRLLADHNDDCGGDSAAGLANCRGTHDLVGLDVREAHDATLGDVVIFRLLLNGGDTGQLKDTLTFKAGSASKTFELTTSNNQAFTGTGFDRVVGPTSINDGTRFAIEGLVQRDSLGPTGTLLADFDVVATRDGTRGDFMPGTYTTLAGPAPTGSSEQNDPASYERPSYALRGPGYYANAALPAIASVAVGASTELTVTFSNLLKNTPQSLAVATTGADGVQAWFSVGAPDGSLAFDLGKGATTMRTLVLTGTEAGASGTLTLTLTSSLGGRSVHTLAYTVTEAPTSPSPTEPPATPSASSTPSKDAPGPGLPLALGLLAFAGLRRRS